MSLWKISRADCDVALRLTAFEIVNGENQGGYHQVGLRAGEVHAV